MPVPTAPHIDGRRLHGEPEFEPASYRLPHVDIPELFTKAWSNATRVRGAFGWFNSGWISAFAHGIATFLEDPAATIDLTIAPVLFPAEHDELTAVMLGTKATDAEALDQVVTLLEEGSASRSALSRYAVAALAWMVVQKRLTLRVAVPVEGSNYHPKVWLFEDGHDTLAIRGSANATGRALTNAIEHLDVDPSWRDRYRVLAYSEMVDAWSKGRDDLLERTVELDIDTLASRVQRFAQEPTQARYERAAEQDEAAERRSMPDELPEGARLRIPDWLNWTSGEYAHQQQAVHAWEDPTQRLEHLQGAGEARRGLFSIVTGGGKTKTALVAATRLHYDLDEPLLLVVAVPGTHLVHQWHDDIQDFVMDGAATPVLTPSLLSKAKRNQLLGEHLLYHGIESSRYLTVMVVTFDLLKNDEFQAALRNALSLAGGHGLLIGDEAHGLGAEGFMSSPPNFFPYRLGLSATPSRYHEHETAALEDYFGGTVFEFTIAQAQASGALVEYDYRIPAIAELSEEEVDAYREASTKVGKAMGSGSDDYRAALLAQRRGILETARAKYRIFEDLIDRLVAEPDGVSNTLVYCSSKNREQLDTVVELLDERPHLSYRVIIDETPPEERRTAIDAFVSGRVDLLVAKRILDEGVDLPSVRRAVLLASSTSPREWIQRRGRVLRKDPSDPAKKATIYDIPALTFGNGLSDDTHLTIVETECDRLSVFNTDALNSYDNSDFISDTRSKYLGNR